jgi:hypothetical protein
MAVSRQMSFEIQGSPDDLLEPAVRALAAMRCYRYSRDGMTVTARTPINWRSVGEVMTVRLVAVGEGRTLVEVSSHSALRTVIFDWGKNNSNLKRYDAAFRMYAALLETVE